MKKIILCILAIFFLVLIVITVQISNNNRSQSEIKSYNATFEQYKEKSLYGADVLTIINKAIDINRANNIQKDENGNYIKDDTNSVGVEIILLSQDEKGEIQEAKYPMERLEKAGLDKFIASFSITKFECTDIQYNKSGKVSNIILKQLEL